MNTRYLTKSRFKLALECPTKLYYNGKKEYANQKIEDPFLNALAQGGFQVGELAKLYFPGGHEIQTLDSDQALQQTDELLKQEEVIIYEAAVRFNNLLVRVDILRKRKNQIELIEVKAKSFNPTQDIDFWNKNGTIVSKWKSYLYDIAFQKYVAMSAFPQYEIAAYLMMVNKTAACLTDGLNQKFRITKGENGRQKVTIAKSISKEDLANPILHKIPVDSYCETIYQGKFGSGNKDFIEYVNLLADCYSRDEKIISPVSKVCGKCEYKATEQEKAHGLKSGFHECWRERLNWTDKDFLEPTVLDIWKFTKKDQCIEEGRIKISQITIDDILPVNDGKAGVSKSERQWLQVQKSQNNDDSFWIDKAGLQHGMSQFVYPLHFIDFETSMVAIPFHKGRRPYEGIAFQFSHHVVYEDGKIEHKGQYLNVEQGKFPNYDFVRNLKGQLEKDNGSIFRYADHENIYLNMIYRQLVEDQEDIPDKNELCEFIRTITQSGEKSDIKWTGPRNMVDMRQLVQRYYYAPAMKGSNSIKKVLPAILNQSKFLQEKYAQPIYGADDGITSLNFKNWQWIQFDNERVVDPYHLLPKLFEDISDKDFQLLSDDDELKDGGAALTAYARMQFEEMSDYERTAISKALLKYCELDTLAMVMIYEAWRDMIE